MIFAKLGQEISIGIMEAGYLEFENLGESRISAF